MYLIGMAFNSGLGNIKKRSLPCKLSRQFWRMALKPSPSLTTRHQHWPALPGALPGASPGIKPHVLVRVRVGQGARVRVDQWGAGWPGCELVLGRVDSKALNEGPRSPLEHRRLGMEMSGRSWGGAEMTGQRWEGAEMTAFFRNASHGQLWNVYKVLCGPNKQFQNFLISPFSTHCLKPYFHRM